MKYEIIYLSILCFENPFVNDTSLDPRPLPSLHMRRRCSGLSWGDRLLLEGRGYQVCVFLG